MVTFPFENEPLKEPVDEPANEIKLLNTISAETKITRKELVKITGLAYSTVKRLIGKLIARGEIEEVKEGRKAFLKRKY